MAIKSEQFDKFEEHQKAAYMLLEEIRSNGNTPGYEPFSALETLGLGSEGAMTFAIARPGKKEAMVVTLTVEKQEIDNGDEPTVN